MAELRRRRVKAVARYLGVDDELEAGLLALVGGGMMLHEIVVSGLVMIVGGAILLGLSSNTRMRGAVA